MKKRVFMTGGTGFLGRSLSDQLARAGYECCILTRKPHAACDGKRYVLGDIRNRARLHELMQELRPEVLVHLAWDVSQKDYASSEENRKWIGWSVGLLEEFLACGGSTVMASGTCMEYDLDVEHPHREEETQIRAGDSLYGICKRETFRSFRTRCEHAVARLLWGRIFYPFGPCEPRRKIFSQAITALASGQTFCCRSPENRVDYIYVEDVAKIFLTLLDAKDAEGIFNIGTGTAVTLKDCLMKIATDLHAEARLSFGEAPGKIIVADMTKTRRFYPEPFVSVLDGLERLEEAIIR